MKRIIFIVIAALSISAAACAQSRAIGLRLGYGVEASYQHSFGKNFLEGDLGWFGGGALNAHVAYDFILAEPQWSKGEWNVYAGPAVGFTGYNGGFLINVGGQLGIDYTFTFPLQLALDIRPDIFSFGSQAKWFYNWFPCLSVRYRF